MDMRQRAAEMAQRYEIGAWIVALDLTEAGSIVVEKTRGTGHYTAWGAATDFLLFIVSYFPLEEA